MSFEWPVAPIAAYILASVRVAALLTAAPIFGHIAIPRQVRVGLALALLLALSPEAPEGWNPLDQTPLLFVGQILREVLIGTALGFSTRLLFGAFSLFGEVISIQSGLGHARVLDPNTGATSVALASLFDLFMIVVYLAIGGHHILVHSLNSSFEVLPLAGAAMPAASLGNVAYLGGTLFEIGTRLAMPVIVAMMVSNLSLGILGRAVPQLNLMMLQLPAHVALGLAIILLGSGSLMRAAANEIEVWTKLVFETVVGAV